MVPNYADRSPDTAFPTTFGDKGLTKREYFAARVMEALIMGHCANADKMLNPVGVNTIDDWIRYIPNIAVRYADALLAELNKTHKPE